MSLIDTTYFVDDINIQNIKSNTVVGSSLISEVSRYIGNLEPRYLRKILGDILAAEFMAGMNVESPAVPDQKWLDLKAKFVDETNKRSPISDYVYFYWARSKDQMITDVQRENGMNVTTPEKLCFAWNRMVEVSYDVYVFVKDNPDTYEGLTDCFPFDDINTFGL